MTRKMFLSGALGLAALAGAAGIAFAQSASSNAHMSVKVNPNGNGSLVGSVSAISGSNLTVASWGGAWSVNAAHARILPREDEDTAGGATSLASIHVGDQVTVAGTFATSSLSITAKRLLDNSIQVRPVASSGTVSGESSTGFTLTTHSGKTFQVNIAAGTTVKAHKNATTTTLMDGDNVQVRGILDTADSVITASHIMIR